MRLPRIALAVAVPLLSAGIAVPATMATASAATGTTAASCSNGYVALTYDDGPKAATTLTMLQTLQASNVKATFFNIGSEAQTAPSLVTAEKSAGMWIGNHSGTHPHQNQQTQSKGETELAKTQTVLHATTGSNPKLFRPPYGETDATLEAVEASLGLTEIIWSVDSQDWNGASTAQIVQAASTLQPGGIILMHDGYQTTINAIPQIVQNLNSRGLCAGGISPTTGKAVAPGSA